MRFGIYVEEVLVAGLFLLSERQMAHRISRCRVLADKGHDADWFRDVLAKRGIKNLYPITRQTQDADPAQRHSLPSAPRDRNHIRLFSRTDAARYDRLPSSQAICTAAGCGFPALITQS
jgi:hypothetical protein